MKKVFIQGLAVVVLFFAVWFALRQVNWLKTFRVEKIKEKREEKIGELIWDAIQQTEKENKTPFVTRTVDSIVTKLCAANGLDRKFIKVHVLDKDDINAFAIPNGHLIIYSGLITASENPEELTGVIGHELAHIQLHHVMKKLIHEVGLSVLISMTSGGGTQNVGGLVKMLSSTAFDRKMEKEADITSVDYLVKANINPEPFANFLYRLATQESEASKYLSWVSTHPDSKERGEYIIEYGKGKVTKSQPIIAKSTWQKLQEEFGVESDE